MKQGNPRPRLPQGNRGLVLLAQVKPRTKAIAIKNPQSNPGDRIAARTYLSEGFQACSDKWRK